MQPIPTEPDETTYQISVTPRSAAAQDWVTHATEDDLVCTLASARDLARDLESPIVLRDEPGFIRGYVDADGGYRLT